MKKMLTGFLTAAAFFSAPAMAETPGSQAANLCTMSLSNTLYGVWPNVRALKVGRLVNAAAKIQLLTSNINETYSLCSTPGWSLSSGGQNVGHNFRAAASPFYGGVAVYRMRHKARGQYFFTSSQGEYNNLLNTQSATWQPEGIAFYVPQPPVAGDYATCPYKHFLSLTKEACIGTPFSQTGLAPVHRFYSATKGHMYTANDQEALATSQNQATNGYTYEGIAFWAFAANALTTPAVLPNWLN